MNQKTLSDKQMAILLAIMVAIMPFSVDAYLPAIKNIAVDLHTDIHLIERSLSTFILGVSAGQLLGGSLSDIKGRKNIALTGLLIYIVASIILIFVNSANQLMVLRLLQALGGGMTAVTVGAIIRDNYDGKYAAQMFALIGIIMMGAPLAAPMLGAVLQNLGGWRSIFAFLCFYGASVFALLWRFLPKRKQAEPFTRHIFHNILMRYRRVLGQKQALGFLFFQATSFSSMMVFLTESPFVYMELYGLTPQQYAWAFGCNIITMATFNRITAWRLKRDSSTQDILLWGIVIQLLTNLILGASVLIMGLPPFAVVVLCVMLSVGTQGLVVANTQALFMQHFREDSGSANALLSANQSLTGAMVGFLATVLHNGTAQILAWLMPTCTIVGVILLWHFSRSQWKR
ncbi:multidrug effflux MFS transporter [Simonsiella muelleri]|uniref:Bcr/CflA family efflux transporter n=1 Tax=Simonsiella muelleri ATCC 29453 TaxID=641147 RepID=V9HMB9_9NEIS|nr:multidrug effflux MFS transporter [Simonsiella muelleri]EFG31823.1 drug resistance transporter, Bcr/CflA subfamily [Simonsiella muelleri ATCC 29453]UBQ54550.1 multidrug effflux MFS transporter [Simonsiella muelleri]